MARSRRRRLSGISAREAAIASWLTRKKHDKKFVSHDLQSIRKEATRELKLGRKLLKGGHCVQAEQAVLRAERLARLTTGRSSSQLRGARRAVGKCFDRLFSRKLGGYRRRK